MALLWRALLLVGSCVSAVQAWPEGDSEDVDVMPQPLHIPQEGHLMVLSAAGLTQMLNQTRFLLVLFCECPLRGRGEMGGDLPPCSWRTEEFMYCYT